jgi:two-component system, OmpR family, sensor histidine kinase VicK
MEETELRKKLEDSEARARELQGKVEELSDFLEHAAMPLHWVNGSGIVIWVNRAELQMLGYEKEEMLNKHISYFHADQPVIEDILQRLINKETLINYPARLKCKDGSIRHVLINSNVWWKDTEFVHTRCVTHDITDYRNRELERNEQIDNLREENESLGKEISRLRQFTT